MTEQVSLVSGPDIEKRSFAIIDSEVAEHTFDDKQWPIVRRIIHASGDLNLAGMVRFGGNPIENTIRALKKGVVIISDTRMASLGISLKRLQKVNLGYSEASILCAIADPEVARLASKHQVPRSVYNMRHLKNNIAGSVVVIGNAPTALWEILRLYNEENIRPATVIGMPVGFVNVCEVKEMLSASDLDYILVTGRRGGTPLAVATINALADLASGTNG